VSSRDYIADAVDCLLKMENVSFMLMVTTDDEPQYAIHAEMYTRQQALEMRAAARDAFIRILKEIE